MPSVLITGGSGFIGTTLREHFCEANAAIRPQDSVEPWGVISVDRVMPRESFPTQAAYPCDLLDYAELVKVFRWFRPDAVIHAAAQARVDPSMTDPLATYDCNVRATLNVMQACKETDVDHLVYLSSEAIYGPARSYPCKENDDFRPTTPYAASKVAGDVLAQQFDRVLPTTVVRSGMGWGPRSNPREQVVAKFIVKALSGAPLRFPAGDVKHPTRDLNHVEDFARGVAAVIRSGERGVFNLSGGREYTVLDIAERVVKAVGSGRIEFTDEFSYREGEEGFRTWLDTEKAAKVLDHKPENHLEGKALNEAIEWYKRHLNGTYWK